MAFQVSRRDEILQNSKKKGTNEDPGSASGNWRRHADFRTRQASGTPSRIMARGGRAVPAGPQVVRLLDNVTLGQAGLSDGAELLEEVRLWLGLRLSDSWASPTC